MHLPVWLIIIPLFMVFSLGIFAYINKKIVKPLVITGGFLQTVLIFFFILRRGEEVPLTYSLGSWRGDIAINLAIDSFSLVMFVLMALMVMLSLIYSLTEIREGSVKFYLLINVLFVGITGMVMTADLFNLYVFFEITSISSYALVAFNDRDISLEAAFKYLMIGTVSAVFLLMAVVLTYQATGTLNMALIPEGMEEVPVLTRQLLFAFYMIGLGVKFAIVPLHTWLPDAYMSVPITYNVLSSGLVVKASFFVLVRILYVLFGVEFLADNMLASVLLIWGIISMLFGHAAAFQQDNLKRLLGYSTIAQMGYVIIAFSLGTAAGIVAGSFHMINHGIMKGAVFFAAGSLRRETDSYELKEMHGLADIKPYTSLIFVLILLSMVGIPPFNGFVSKWLILEASVEAGNLIAAFLVIAGSFLSLGYYLSIILNIYTGYEGSSENTSEVRLNEALPTGILAVLCLVLGFVPTSLLAVIGDAPVFILERHNFISLILGG